MEQYSGETLRFALLSAHYRSPLNFSKELLDNAQATLDSFYLALRNAGDTAVKASEAHLSPVFNALLDDLNTPAAIAELHQLAKALNKASESEKAVAKAALLAGGAVLGILSEDPAEWLSKSDSDGDGLTAEVIDQMLIDRAEQKPIEIFREPTPFGMSSMRRVLSLRIARQVLPGVVGKLEFNYDDAPVVRMPIGLHSLLQVPLLRSSDRHSAAQGHQQIVIVLSHVIDKRGAQRNEATDRI